MNQGGGEADLKYLGFFPAAVASVCLYLSNIYEAVKNQAGPLKPGVEDVEDVLKTVLKPVIKIAGDQSLKLLYYVDKKVDEKLKFVDEHMPAFIKPIAFHAQQMIFQGDPMAVLNVKTSGFEGSTSSHAGACDKEPCSDAFRKIVAGLHMSGILKMVGPSVMYSADLFNHFASSLRDAQVPFSSYIPEVPIQTLEKALKASRNEACWQPWQLQENEGAC